MLMGAKRMWSWGRSGEEESKRGSRIWLISRRSLSRRQEKRRVRGRSSGSWREGSAEGPGSGGVVGDVDQDGRGAGKRKKLEAAGPVGIADTGFDVGAGDFVTVLVACFFIVTGWVT